MYTTKENKFKIKFFFIAISRCSTWSQNMQDIDLNKATQPYEYYMKYIKENRRPDGRRLSEIRPCSVRLDCIQNTVHGSATVYYN